MHSPASSVAATRPPLVFWARAGAVALLGSLLLVIAAHVAVPFWPVPMTLQTLVVLLLGALAGPGIAVAAVVAYAAEGLIGLPVFAHGAGLTTLFGPTGGYLAGFVPAALVAGLAARFPRGPAGAAGAAATLLVADGVILALGVAWLAHLIGVEKAVAAGLVPFLLGEALKVGLATVVVQLRARPRA